MKFNNVVFVVFPGLLVALLNVSAPLALGLGMFLGFALNNEQIGASSNKWSKELLKISVVGLGFGLNAGQLLGAGVPAVFGTLAAVLVVIGLGLFIGKLFQTSKNITYLITFGTAICGGSAIAALAPVISAKSKEISLSLAVVFSLNAIGILTFPYLGGFLELSQTQFAIWAATSLHDTSAVAAACAAYGEEALALGTLIKLTRAFWIFPLIVLFAGRQHKARFPLFIVGFVLAAACSPLISFSDELYGAAKLLLLVSVFLIGCSFNRQLVKEIEPKTIALGVLLWLLVGVNSLWITRLVT